MRKWKREKMSRGSGASHFFEERMMMGLSRCDIVVAVSRGARSSDYLFHPEYPLRIDMAVPPVVSASSVQPQYITTIGVVKYLMKYVVKPPVQSSFTRGRPHVHMLLDADFDEEDDDTDTDASDESSISSNDDDIPALVER